MPESIKKEFRCILKLDGCAKSLSRDNVLEATVPSEYNKIGEDNEGEQQCGYLFDIRAHGRRFAHSDPLR